MKWSKRLGSIGLVAGFVGMLVLCLVVPELAEWADKTDSSWFYLSRHKRPSSGFLAIIAGIAFGTVFAIVGWVIDKLCSPNKR